MEALLPIKLEVMTLHTTTTMRFPLDESQHHRLLQFNEFDELQLKAHQSIKVALAQQKRFLIRRWKKRSSKKVTLSWCLTFDIITRLIRNYCPSGLDPLLLGKVFTNNGFYELENLDGSPYLDRINHEYLKKVLDMWFQGQNR